MSARHTLLSLGVAGLCLAASDSARRSSPPRSRGTQGWRRGKRNRLGFHFMIAPLAKWRINVFEAHFNERYLGLDFTLRELLSRAIRTPASSSRASRPSA